MLKASLCKKKNKNKTHKLPFSRLIFFCFFSFGSSAHKEFLGRTAAQCLRFSPPGGGGGEAARAAERPGFKVRLWKVGVVQLGFPLPFMTRARLLASGGSGFWSVAGRAHSAAFRPHLRLPTLPSLKTGPAPRREAFQELRPRDQAEAGRRAPRAAGLGLGDHAVPTAPWPRATHLPSPPPHLLLSRAPDPPPGRCPGALRDQPLGLASAPTELAWAQRCARPWESSI